MKKNKYIVSAYIVSAIFTVILVACIIVAVFQLFNDSENYDSLHLTDKEIEDMQYSQKEIENMIKDEKLAKMLNSGPDTIIKVYSDYVIEYFQEDYSIDEIAELAYRKVYYIWPHLNEPMDSSKFYPKIRFYSDDETGVKSGVYSNHEERATFAQYAIFPEMIFGTNIRVHKTYYFYQGDRDASFIYYNTNKGEYVLYQLYPYHKDLYLIPFSDFYALQKDLWNLRMEWGGKDGMMLMTDVCDMSKYLITPKEYKPSLPWLSIVITASVVIIASSMTTAVILNKRKKQPEPENEE